ncbi:MAG: glutamate mutase L [Anaerolineae bacterium]
MAVSRSGSVLAADFGSVHTRAVLIDLVDGAYRMVARSEGPSTAGFPVDNLTVGLNRVLTALSETTGRNFLAPDGQIISPEQADRSGVDHFVMTASLGRPLRTVLIGLMPDVSIASGLRAAAGTYINIVETLSLADRRSEEEQLNAILLSRPDLIFITGGTEYGAQSPVLRHAEVVRLALMVTDESRRAGVLYAGNSALAERIRALFEGVATVFFAPNIRPSLDDEQLESAQTQLALAFNRQKAKGGEGFEELNRMSRFGVLPTANSYNLVVDLLGRNTARGVLAVDVGSAVSTLCASLGGEVATSIRTDIGLGHSAAAALNVISVEAVKRWLPFNANSTEISNYAYNKTLRPGTVPQTLRELYLEHGLLRAGVQALIKASRPAWNESARTKNRATLPDFGLVIGAGSGLTRTGHPGYNALLMIDAVQPTGVTLLQADPFGLLATMGPLALVNPEAVVQIIDGSNLEKIGTVFSISGLPRAGRTAMKVSIKLSDGTTSKHTVEGGTLWVYPLPIGQKAQVSVSASGGTNIGGKGSVKVTVEGGLVGLIFDARGRPLPLAADVRARAEQFVTWVSQMTGDEPIAIDPAWFEEVAEEKVEKPAAKPQRGKAPKAEKKPKEKKPARGKAAQPAAASSEDVPLPEDDDSGQDALRSLLDDDTRDKKRRR